MRTAPFFCLGHAVTDASAASMFATSRRPAARLAASRLTIPPVALASQQFLLKRGQSSVPVSDLPPSLLPGWSPPLAPRLVDRSPLQWASVYGELAKSRLSGLVVATTTAGYLMTSAPLDGPGLASALGGTFLLSASANSFNQLMEVSNDAAMTRTAKRPLPSGRISATHAAGWATFAGAAGVSTLFLGTNCVTTILGASTLGVCHHLSSPHLS